MSPTLHDPPDGEGAGDGAGVGLGLLDPIMAAHFPVKVTPFVRMFVTENLH